jgi:DNA polymerase III epsilon subunit-like protein
MTFMNRMISNNLLEKLLIFDFTFIKDIFPFMKAIEKQIVVIDFECTGVVEGYQNEPWQVSMVLLNGGKIDIDYSFNSLCRVGDRPFNPNAPGDYHKLRQQISDAPAIQDIWPELKSWWLGRTLAAHNIGTEKTLIESLAPMHNVGPWLDSLRMSRIAYPELKSHKLEDLIDSLGISDQLATYCPVEKWHDAYFDTIACALLLEHLLSLEHFNNLSVAEINNLKAIDYYKNRQK